MRAPELLGGRYELGGLLGRGGMAEVHDGWDTRLGRAVALKLLYPGYLGHPDTTRRFLVEAHSAAALSHPNIVAVYDVADHNGAPFIAMERLPGQSLADRLAHGPLSEEQVRRVLDDVLAALSAAHAAGILHRDIKPANILFAASGEAKVADFGVAKTPWADHTLTGQIIGTMAYLSPDRVAGKRATAADDLYAVGVVGYESLAGRRPYDHDNMAALARAIVAVAAPSLGSVRPDVDPALVAVIDRAMGRTGEAPFADAAEMRAALAATGAARTVRATAGARPPTRVMTAPVPSPATVYVPRPRPARPRARVLLMAAAIVSALVVALAFLVDAATGNRQPDPVPVTTSTPVSTPPLSSAPAPPTQTPVQTAVPTAQQEPPGNPKPGKRTDKGPRRGRD